MLMRGFVTSRGGRTAVAALCAAFLVAVPTAVGVDGASGAPAARAKASRCKVRAPTPAEGPSAQAEVVQEGSGSEPQVAMARYPRPDREPGGSNPWSQWGQGLVLRDGRFLSAIGDHAGIDGNSYLFVYEPQSRRITRFADVLSAIEHEPGEPGYGKIHGQIVAGRCNDAYFATYWGDRDDLRFGGSYQGDHLFRIDLRTLRIESLGVPVARHGIPSLAATGDGLVYGEAVDPVASERAGRDVGAFFVYDTRRREVVFRSDDKEHSLFRNIALDGRGNAYVAGQSGKLLRYEPGASELSATDVALPGGGPLRASTAPAPDGTVYGATQANSANGRQDQLFALTPDGSTRSLGRARGYTASMALESDGSRLYYVPGAHGDSYEQGTPVIAVDTRTGEESVVARLNPLAEEHLGLTLGGSYDIALDAERRQLYVGLNAGPSRDEPWNEVVLAVIGLPA